MQGTTNNNQLPRQDIETFYSYFVCYKMHAQGSISCTLTVNMQDEPFPTIHMHCKHEKMRLCCSAYDAVAHEQLTSRLLGTSTVSLPSRV